MRSWNIGLAGNVWYLSSLRLILLFLEYAHFKYTLLCCAKIKGARKLMTEMYISSRGLSNHQLIRRQSHMQDDCALEDVEAKPPHRKPGFSSGCVTWDEIPGLLLRKQTTTDIALKLILDINRHCSLSSFFEEHISLQHVLPVLLQKHYILSWQASSRFGEFQLAHPNCLHRSPALSGCSSRNLGAASLVYAAFFSLWIARRRTATLGVSHLSFWKAFAFDS